ncbi:MAG TPA: orotidine-5'-phosphate decarboxylase [Planctomycetaceae bacterium]|nr:orotidine-5'-phosphate decarboxylase [Planctomycetaceae bacterium]
MNAIRMQHYATRLHDAVRRKSTPALVGLDPRFDLLPPDVVRAAEARGPAEPRALAAAAFEEFCFRLIDVVAPLVPAVKPQAAFFEELGPPGCAALARVIGRAREAGLVVICDAKRGDIGSTAEAYARGYLAGADPGAAAWAADALTVNPYLGRDTLEPFVRVAVERGAGLYVLVRTSNPGAGTFQDRASDGLPLYRHVAQAVEDLALQTADEAGGFGAVGAVVGATWPAELAELRAAMPHAPLLIPGYGTQGGGAADVAAAFRPGGLGAVVNSSRAINFAFRSPPWTEQFGPERWEDAAAAATRAMIADLAAHVR